MTLRVSPEFIAKHDNYSRLLLVAHQFLKGEVPTSIFLLALQDFVPKMSEAELRILAEDITN